ncbi:MAG: hypothetical protein LQ345_002284 [Seirophora villosa]|nr:MAG: hypothetical protein LQ345_002284 [Seirophora villosa]
MANSPTRQTCSEALVSSQKASGYIESNGTITHLASFPLFTHESPEQWTTYEHMLYSCLRTGDDKAAHFFLQKLALRFGKNDERVMGLRGLYQEAMAEDSSVLLQMSREYDEILVEDPTNTPVRKRQITLLRSLSREADAINALVELLVASPTDIESWAELAELYVSQGLYQQAEYCLEEILLSTPNAWNVCRTFRPLQKHIADVRARFMRDWARYCTFLPLYLRIGSFLSRNRCVAFAEA